MIGINCLWISDGTCHYGNSLLCFMYCLSIDGIAPYTVKLTICIGIFSLKSIRNAVCKEKSIV